MALSSVPLPVRGLSNVTAVAAGYRLTLALKKDGTVWAVGYGAAGQLGNGSMEDSSKPVMVSGLTGVKAVAAGYMHALALKNDGTVWSWGYNHESQLGNARVRAEQSAKPVRSGTLSGVVAIAASASHSAAVTGPGVV
jgi:alpha-tubulin suppressor-like RCC1 family protein